MLYSELFKSREREQNLERLLILAYTCLTQFYGLNRVSSNHREIMSSSPLGQNFGGLGESNPADILRGDKVQSQQDVIPKKGQGDMVGQMLDFLQRSSMSGLLSMFQNNSQSQNNDNLFQSL